MVSEGTLTVRVYTSRAQIPVQGATVVVTRKGKAGKRELISVQATDSSGLVRTIRIPTPPAGESTSPEGANGTNPFALCAVWAEHPGFAMLQVDGVQIFSGVETMQDMELIPLGEGETSLGELDERTIPAQDL